MSKKSKRSKEKTEEYTVEKILDKRITAGKTEYFLKWHGYPDSENTWEPEENLDCPEIIAEFERQFNRKDRRSSIEGKRRTDSSDLSSRMTVKKKHEEEKRGFDRNLEPDKIIGATDTAGELMFLIKWKGCDEADLVSSKIANVKCPQVVIRFYEERLIWHPNNSCEGEQSEAGNKSQA
ncbi:chromobox protein homolog 1-like [Argiope bruennichi]|uniref:chromobox protein homolog 1-like n=1 Tax=Argiope bruennichi TaxID=94029 RepID=UPI002494C2F9|nr:chromobox protein homolog 1-like [Argiope bruennichi]